MNDFGSSGLLVILGAQRRAESLLDVLELMVVVDCGVMGSRRELRICSVITKGKGRDNNSPVSLGKQVWLRGQRSRYGFRRRYSNFVRSL